MTSTGKVPDARDSTSNWIVVFPGGSTTSRLGALREFQFLTGELDPDPHPLVGLVLDAERDRRPARGEPERAAGRGDDLVGRPRRPWPGWSPSRTWLTAGPVRGTPVPGSRSSSWRTCATSGSPAPTIDARASTRVRARRYSARVSGAAPAATGASSRTYGRPLTVAACTRVEDVGEARARRASGCRGVRRGRRRPGPAAGPSRVGVSITTPRLRFGCSSATTVSPARTCCARERVGARSDEQARGRPVHLAARRTSRRSVSRRNGSGRRELVGRLGLGQRVGVDDEPVVPASARSVREHRGIERLRRGDGVVDRGVEAAARASRARARAAADSASSSPSRSERRTVDRGVGPGEDRRRRRGARAGRPRSAVAAGFVAQRHRAGERLGVRDEGDRHPADLLERRGEVPEAPGRAELGGERRRRACPRGVVAGDGRDVPEPRDLQAASATARRPAAAGGPRRAGSRSC